MDRARHYGSRDNFQAKCLAMDDEADMLAIRIRENARIEAANVRGIGRGRRCRRDQQHAHIDARSPHGSGVDAIEPRILRESAASSRSSRRARLRIFSQSVRWPRQIAGRRSEEHTSELQSLMRTSYAV